ncbi:MAG: FadR/GntR family transcriptional regulator [Candidatus Dormibacteraceae bacterium]
MYLPLSTDESSAVGRRARNTSRIVLTQGGRATAQPQGARRERGGRRSGVADEAITKISEMIERGAFGPGDRLPRESDLAALLGLSRSSLREAIRALALVGAVEVRQGAGTYITGLTPDHLLGSIRLATQLLPAGTARELFEVRRMLEPRVTAMAAARMTAAQLEVLDDDLCHLRAAAANSDPDGLSAADGDFHATIAHSVGNTFLSALQDALALSTLRAQIWQTRMGIGPEGLRGIVAAHERIRNAIASRDPGLAATASEAHLANAEAWLWASGKVPRVGTPSRVDEWSPWLEPGESPGTKV